MDYWREYFGSANIFEIIQGAIMLAAYDSPQEFKLRRDEIAQLLFSCKFIQCSGCDKHQLAIPVIHHHAHNHDDEGVHYKTKESSKFINCSRNDNDDDENDDVGRDHVSTYSYGDAEALTDEIELESQTFAEVMRIKEIVDNRPHESVSVLCNSLRKLQLMTISVETLKGTEIGKSVNVLRKHGSKDVRHIARGLIEMWKDMVDEWVNTTQKMAGSEATPESMNPSVLDEEEGLPSPPLDDLAFLNPHSMSLELSEKFFDGMDDYGNPRKSAELNKDRHNGDKQPAEKQNISKWKQQKQTTVKPSKPLVADRTPTRVINQNMDRKLQSPEKPVVPKRQVAPQQRKPISSDGETVQDKLEATKRKLQERYQQAENAKRQRTIQVMELHDLPSQQSIAPKNQQMRPGNNHNRNWANGRF
uniref:Probable mediator of RNA polymerase II transcription subunit 26b n=1 Tax=Tanacetum cinerariifolium TaxID=118510 RepID=A0A699GRE8_TANCI|nr:probable mediator of RNA polymerase II transcription subunit 26b [Tanacetum cinerariifolium]